MVRAEHVACNAICPSASEAPMVTAWEGVRVGLSPSKAREEAGMLQTHLPCGECCLQFGRPDPGHQALGLGHCIVTVCVHCVPRFLPKQLSLFRCLLRQPN